MADAPDEGLPSPKRMDIKRRKARRYIAVAAFSYLVIQSTVVLAFLMLSPERNAIMAVLQGLSPMIIATNAMLVSVVGAYFGVSLTEKLKTGGK